MQLPVALALSYILEMMTPSSHTEAQKVRLYAVSYMKAKLTFLFFLQLQSKYANDILRAFSHSLRSIEHNIWWSPGIYCQAINSLVQ